MSTNTRFAPELAGQVIWSFGPLESIVFSTPGMLPGACETPHPRPRTVSAFFESIRRSPHDQR